MKNDKITVTYKIQRSEGKLRIIDMAMSDPERNEAFHLMELNIRLPGSEARSCKPAITTEKHIEPIQVIEINDNDDKETCAAEKSSNKDPGKGVNIADVSVENNNSKIMNKIEEINGGETMPNMMNPTTKVDKIGGIHETTDSNANDDIVNRNKIELTNTEDMTIDIEQVIVESNENPDTTIKQEVEQDDPLGIINETEEADIVGNQATERNSLDMIRFLYDDNNE